MDDAITTEILRYGLLGIAEEMARNLCRTAYNTVVYEIHDYGIGLHDSAGDVVADAPGIAVFTRGNDYGIKRILEFLGPEALMPGDILLLNYPYWASAHTLDPLVFAPIHHDGRLIGFASCRVHVLDLKQKDPGYVIDSVDMYQEGLFFPGVKLYRAGHPEPGYLQHRPVQQSDARSDRWRSPGPGIGVHRWGAKGPRDGVEVRRSHAGVGDGCHQRSR